MTSDPTFTASFRRPGVDEPGRQITMEIGATGTRLSLDEDVLGTWSNEAIRFSPTPEPTLTIAGEAWLLDMDDVEAFRSVAQTRYLPSDVPPVMSKAPEVTSSPGATPPNRGPRGSEESPAPVPEKAQSGVLPWSVLVGRRRFTTLAIASTTAVALLAASIAIGGALAAATGFAAGGAGLTGWVAWRGIAAARRRRVQSSVGPDIDAEARVARAVAHAFSARTVTSTLETQAMEELTSIKGIGPQYAQLLIDVGVKSIESLAHITMNQRTELESALGRHSHRVVRERWVEQARRIIDDRDRSHTFG